MKPEKLKNIILIGDRVLIKAKSANSKTKGGLVLPPGYSEREEVQSGYVIKTGPGYPIPLPSESDIEPWKSKDEAPSYIPLQAKPGDLALFLQKGAIEIVIDSEKYFIVSHQSLLLLERDEELLLENHRIIALIALASSWFLIFPSCQRNIQQDEDSGFRLDTIASPQYAGLFVAGYIHHHRAVWLKDPWDTTKIYSRFIILSHRLPNDSIPHGYQPIILPVNSIATTSSTLISHLSSLNILDHLIGVADTSYIFHPYIRQRIHDRQVQEIARGDRIEAESLIACRPDLSFITLYAGQDYSRFQQMGLQIVPLADYMENHPLGRAEWIRFVGYFVGKEKEADSIFRQIASEYSSVQKKVSHNDRPARIFDGFMNSGVWYVSGGRSYMAQLYKDAGLSYVFSDLNETASKGLGFEEVFSRAHDADYWRIVVSQKENFSLQDLLNLDKRYVLFESARKQKVVVCNASHVPLYEEGVAHPELILSDLVYLTRPELLPDYTPRYYQIIE